MYSHILIIVLCLLCRLCFFTVFRKRLREIITVLLMPGMAIAFSVRSLIQIFLLSATRRSPVELTIISAIKNLATHITLKKLGLDAGHFDRKLDLGFCNDAE